MRKLHLIGKIKIVCGGEARTHTHTNVNPLIDHYFVL